MTVKDTGTTAATRLGRILVDLTYEDLPSDVLERAKELILDQIGCQLAGAATPWCKIVADFVRGFASNAGAVVVGNDFSTWAHDAAFANATSGHGCELDDHIDSGGGHPGVMTIPVALAIGEQERLPGKALIAAIVAGYEAAWRLGRAMPPGATRGFHSQTILGVFSSTAVAGRLLELDADQMAHAFAIAGSHAGGTQEYDQAGGSVKRMHAGLAARAGIHSAMLARDGLTGPLTIFEGRYGVLRMFSDRQDVSPLVEEPGEDWGIRHVEIKSYPATISHQSPIRLLTDLAREHSFTAGDVARVDVGMKSEFSAGHVSSVREPHDVLTAQFSLPFSLALALVRGSNDLDLYLDPSTWADPDLLHVSKNLVHIAVDPRLADLRDGGGCYLTVTLKDGTVLEAHERYQKGHAKNPHTRDELVGKFSNLAGRAGMPDGAIDRLVGAVDGFERLEDPSDLMALLR